MNKYTLIGYDGNAYRVLHIVAPAALNMDQLRDDVLLQKGSQFDPMFWMGGHITITPDPSLGTVLADKIEVRNAPVK